MSSQFEQLVQTAIAEAKLGNKKKAKEILVGLVKQEPGNARALYLLSQLVEDPAQAADCGRRTDKGHQHIRGSVRTIRCNKSGSSECLARVGHVGTGSTGKIISKRIVSRQKGYIK
jgi:hypothetical protein